MTRVDKVVPGAGNFRAPLAANFAFTSATINGITAPVPNKTHADLNKMFVVSLNASGQVVIGSPLASTTGIVGVITLGEPQKAGSVIDVYQWAEFVEFTLTGGGAAAAGTWYYSAADGLGGYAPALTAGATIARLGHTVEAGRFLVRIVPANVKLAS